MSMVVTKCSRLLRLGSRPSVKLLKAVIGMGLLFESTLDASVSAPNRGHTTRDLRSVTWTGFFQKRSNDGLQLRHAISIQAEGPKLLGKHAGTTAPAKLC